MDLRGPRWSPGRAPRADRSAVHPRGNRTFYLSVSAKFYGSGCRAWRMPVEEDPKRSRVVIEKPFGRDYGGAQSSAGWFRAAVRKTRSSHRPLPGQETVQNILVLRFANTIFEPIWNRNYISSVQITAAETVGVEERAGYYESSGPAGHGAEPLTQMLAIPPWRHRSLRPGGDPHRKGQGARTARLADELEPWNCCIRGQCRAGAARRLPGRLPPGTGVDEQHNGTCSP